MSRHRAPLSRSQISKGVPARSAYSSCQGGAAVGAPVRFTKFVARVTRMMSTTKQQPLIRPGPVTPVTNYLRVRLPVKRHPSAQMHHLKKAQTKLYVMKQVSANAEALALAPRELQDDRDVVLTAVARNGLTLQYASKTVRDDEGVVLAAVEENGFALEFASETLRGSEKVVLAAVKQNGLTLEFASETLRDNKNVVSVAVTQNCHALSFASEPIKNNREVVRTAVAKDWVALQYASNEIKNDKTEVLAAMAVNVAALKHASEGLKNDKDVILAAVARHGSALQYASDRLKNDKDVVLAAVAQGGYGPAQTLRHAHKALQASKTLQQIAAIRDDADRRVVAADSATVSAVENEHQAATPDFEHRHKRSRPTEASALFCHLTARPL